MRNPVRWLARARRALPPALPTLPRAPQGGKVGGCVAGLTALRHKVRRSAEERQVRRTAHEYLNVPCGTADLPAIAPTAGVGAGGARNSSLFIIVACAILADSNGIAAGCRSCRRRVVLPDLLAHALVTGRRK